ncbi:unnamed protein product [Chrysodeixis includens]|uniref:F-box domain-containing protein n=1 Tax=Chrysodeixis includens TaxID=689277 RepID=A0A9P0BZC0_CHRIL|nr:unnamed protein product [Chrysodeixis includens]
MAEISENSLITILPNEILYMILKHNSCREILNFGSTCKRFYEVVNDDQFLWKDKLKKTAPQEVYHLVVNYGNGLWLKEIKRYYNVKHAVHAELLSMSSKYYWRTTEISMNDIKGFFALALSYNSNHYYVVTTLKEIIKTGNECLEMNLKHQLYTMTELYYAKIVLRYLTQTYFAIKWFQNRMRNVLTPDLVLNFFIEWIDPDRVLSYADVEAVFSDLIDLVEKQFSNTYHPELTVLEKVLKGYIKPSNLLVALSEVVYRQNTIGIGEPAILDALDITQVWQRRYGNVITVAVIYQAVASRCGVHCELIAFPNHLFLEWRDPDVKGVVYKIDVTSGNISQKGRCPYSRGVVRDDIRFCPDTFLQYIITSFLMAMGVMKNGSTLHARNLQDFLSTEPSDDNPYKNYQEYLLYYDNLPAMTIVLNPVYIDDVHLKMLEHLVTITHSPMPVTKAPKVTTRHGNVRFAVGLICYHQKYDYVCIILGWDPICSIDVGNRLEFQSLRYGLKQTFYNVVAIDQSERYVAQEYLIDLPSPNRLTHLEDVIAKYFTHYNGYCYVPNNELESEYPNDGPIRAIYKDKYELRCEHLRQQVIAAQII